LLQQSHVTAAQVLSQEIQFVTHRQKACTAVDKLGITAFSNFTALDFKLLAVYSTVALQQVR